jgi:hypothetical protein
MNGLLVARYLGPQADAARRSLLAVWSVVRKAHGRQVVSPRIWQT